MDNFFHLFALLQKKERKPDNDLPLVVESPAFNNEGFIPGQYTGFGKNISPPIKWSTIPFGTKSFALICDEFYLMKEIITHWILFNIPKNMNKIDEYVPEFHKFDAGNEADIRQGVNEFKKIGYDGPNTSTGLHKYYFRLYAIDIKLELDNGITKAQLLQAMEGHILSEGELIGKYSHQDTN
jgi:Raf kinase inhibitor-like YbhB/YbcL family protein